VRILGIVNITDDSFSDGGKFLSSRSAIDHAVHLSRGGADIVDLGAASSNPEASRVPPAVEIERLAPVIRALRKGSVEVSVDSFSTEVQRFALSEGVHMLNDIHGFADPDLYKELGKSSAMLVVMHSVQKEGVATKANTPAQEIVGRILNFFDERVETLLRFVSRDRLILDPGLGFFLGTDPACSFAAIRAIPEIKSRYGLPVLISASRKSFLGAVTGRAVLERSAATLACELEARRLGADYIRTHDPAALLDGCKIQDQIYS